ncbi:alpha/beta hydrolase family protein [Paenibacillus protaetiae]|uniref:Alpha/beta hydrolase n=1 Tax=Paenibacillus protaetiae TaxID=2509456 RepID=A0A4P6ETN0_9BACL|nr:alpha/beta hydrolase [Paenibacillus protaetiae]QAY66282.1 alpha/beta hydrolase [Paenibacillus protaetiae]
MSNEVNTAAASPGQPLTVNSRTNRRRKIGGWLRNRFAARNAYNGRYWQAGTAAMAALGMTVVWIAILSSPTGLGPAADLLLAGLLQLLCQWLAGNVLAIIFSALYIPVSRRFAAHALYTAGILFGFGYYANLTWVSGLVIAAALTFAAALAGMLIYTMRRHLIRSSRSTMILAAAGAALVLAAVIAWPPGGAQHLTLAEAGAIAAGPAPIQAGNPADMGPYLYEEWAYGSGTDRHRSDFGSHAKIVTEPVDASAYISKWPWLKKLFWGFDQKQLPVNGRVWMPEGSGPYPLVLIVHGNHIMEDFSDDGYAYIGQLLASRGYIAVSVDENFLNYSAWSDIPDNDMKVRAWMLLKHLQQLKGFSGEAGSPFYGKVDWDNVALIGHSRGGQAVSMAADKDKWFAGDGSLQLGGVRIRSVVAIAPTDREVDGRKAELVNVNFLTLQGARDADVNDFYGDQQYIRTRFTPSSGGFKSSIYLTNANHGQFNTSWGSMDEVPPGGLLLNLRRLMNGEDQREVAKVYISAFLDTTLKGDKAYKPLFQDYRNGSAWLPASTAYVNQYEDDSFVSAADYDEDRDLSTIRMGTAAGTGFTDWEEADALDRSRNAKGTRGVVLEWDGSREAEYTLTLDSWEVKRLTRSLHEGGAAFTFAMADLARDQDPNPAGYSFQASDLVIKVTAADGRTESVPLDRLIKPAGPVFVTYAKLPRLLENTWENGKYKQSNEPVFQTVRLPLNGMDVWDIASITFQLKGSGRIMLDNIGFAQAE